MSKRQQAIELWRACFNDTEEFIQFYFAHKYRDENTLISYEEERAIAVTQMLPYPMTWCGTQIATSYISGACTLPEVRGKGVMKNLLAEAFAIMKNQGIGLSTLIPAEPWLFGFYQKNGYSTIFDYTTEKYVLEPSATPQSDDILCVKEFSGIAKALYPWFSRKMEERKSCIQHTFDDYMTILQDFYADGGKLFIAYEIAGTTVGIAFAIPSAGRIYVPELLWNSPVIKQSLLQSIASEWGINSVECHTPPVPGPVEHKGMARIISAEQMLGIYARYYPDKNFSLKLTDHQLPVNNGYYILKGGNCIHPDNFQDVPDFDMDIQTLTQVILGYHPEQLNPSYSLFKTEHQPYMSLMLE